MDQVHADVRMIAQDTGLWEQSYADKVMSDVIRFAEKHYLDVVQVRLVGANGKNLRVYRFEICEGIYGWEGARAGGNLSSVAATRLTVTLTYSDTWQSLTATQQATFRTALQIDWVDCTDDLSVDHLTERSDRRYASNGYGAEKKVYE